MSISGLPNMTLFDPYMFVCIPPFARGNATDNPAVCDCLAGYRGDACREVIPWWTGSQWAVYIICLVVFCFLALWALLRFVYAIARWKFHAKKDERFFSLLNVAIILNLLGYCFRIYIRTLIPPGITQDYLGFINNLVKISAVNSVSIMLFVASLAILMGFWVDAMRAKLKMTFALRTKIACFAAAIIQLATIPGYVLSLSSDPHEQFLALFFLVLPYVLDLLIFITVTLILRFRLCMPSTDLSAVNKAKLNYVTRYFIIATAAFAYIVIIGAIGNAVMVSPHGYMKGLWMLHSVTVAELVFTWAIMSLAEYNTGLVFLIKRLIYCDWKAPPLTRTTTGSTNSNGSGKSSRSSTAKAHASASTSSSSVAHIKVIGDDDDDDLDDE